MRPYMVSETCPDELVNPSLKTLKKGSRRVKSSLCIQNSKNKLSKPHPFDLAIESPYAQIQAMPKNRSISSLKIKNPPKIHTSYLNTSSTTALLTKSRSNLTGTQAFHIPENVSALKQRFLAPQNSGKTQARLIEEKLVENLKKMKEKHKESREIEAFRAAFLQIIENDENYGSLLKRVKEAYEDQLKFESSKISKDQLNKLREENNEFKEKISSHKSEVKSLMKKIEKFAKENTELSRILEDREARYIDLQEKLLKLSKIDLTDMPMDENTWKYLTSENQHLLKVCEDMRKDIKHLTRKEKKLVKLIVALKNRGYPVEDVYQEDVHKEKKSKIKNCDEPLIDNSDNEDLLSGRPKSVNKPSVIPMLKLEEIEVSESSSESSDINESEEP